MQAFISEAVNQPGEFARHAEAIAERGVNLSNVVCLGLGDRGGAAFMAADEAGLRTALNDAGIAFREVPIVTVAIDDRPGTAAAAARTLADAGVNIDLMAGVGMTDDKVTLAIGVDKVEEARRALGDLVTEWSASRVTANTR
ncbi:MAG: ACT domain-containing protein [Chloroflexi bacterium]|nr:ACT domain-containing protein [Chloroflexota bacterium]